MSYIVNTPCGAVQGVPSGTDGVIAYKGIRYATAGRWEYPVQVTGWEGIYNADSYGACCYQRRSFYNEAEDPKKAFIYKEFRKGESFSYSEDCLFLNIFTPETAKEGDRLPVVFYIHGGSFTGGCSHEKPFNVPVWSQKGVIGVTIHYRLGPLGFACFEEAKEEAGRTGNYGFYDQLTALQWVRDNISAFGGDPGKITIMGQSAGAMSVQRHCFSPLTDGLFTGAVMCSGGGVSRALPCRPAEKMYEFWKNVMEMAGCENLAQLRAVSPEKLYEAWQKAQKEKPAGAMGGCYPCIDGEFVPAAQKAKDIAYMAGITSEDMMVPILFSMSKKWCDARGGKGYVWYFDRQLPGDKNGAWHSSDLWYWLGTLDKCWRPMTEKDYELSEQMVDYLVNFAKSGNPNGEGLPEWRAASKRQKKVMCLGERPTAMRRVSKLKMLGTMLTKKSV